MPAHDSPASSSAEDAFLLSEKIAEIVDGERASFHTPGHKGRPQSFGKGSDFLFDIAHDVTELPGLDDLSDPDGVLSRLETRLAALFGARRSFLSVNGASACLMASMLAASSVGRKILVPTNLHRAAVNGLTLANLEPVWYTPEWNENFGFYQHVSVQTVELALQQNQVGALLVVSPTYAGAMSDIAAIASLCKKKGILLIVDEAHGAHLLPQSERMSGDSIPVSALQCGADIVVHSLHKTLSALTQTGVLHIAPDSQFSLDHIRSLLTCVQSSSPSYHLMASIELVAEFLNKSSGWKRLNGVIDLAKHLRDEVQKFHTGSKKMQAYNIYSEGAEYEPLHVVIRPSFPVDLASELRARGIGIETTFGSSVLLLLGLGTEAPDIQVLIAALREIAEGTGADCGYTPSKLVPAPPVFQQEVLPSQVLALPSHVVPIEKARDCICVECIAPCPPGTPVVVPGQRLTGEAVEYMLKFTDIRSLRVVQKT